MKIAMVSEHANPLAVIGGVDAGGQNIHVAALSAALARRGHDVTVFTRRDDPAVPTQVRTADGYTVEHVPAGPPTDVPKDDLLPHMSAFGDYLAERWVSEPFDIAHAHFWMSGLAATRAARTAAIPVVQTFHALGTVKRRHQGANDTSPPERIHCESELCAGVDHIIATCTDEVKELSAMGVDDGLVSVVPCGVNLDLFRPKAQLDAEFDAELGQSCRVRLLSVGRLVERKGLADIVDALPDVPEAELVVAGGPSADALWLDPEVQRLTARAQANGTADRLRFLGRVRREQMPGLFTAGDLVVTVPWYEPFGIVPVEAMACGRPVVGSAVGGLLDTVVPGVTGEVVPPHDPGRLAEVLRELIDDPDRRRAYGHAGVERARSRYSWHTVARRTEDAYAWVRSRTSAASPAQHMEVWR
ncbi:glycosyltransferase [Phytoactinopolyspora halotolerans]|uniref:Glycosyltransferase family 1 protein n=1 Tax=Phytoactinopolyspora halotolerans TaxID=1981512 RepID=A0A6L9SAY4_9ACTN|nr:glycosyltransferase [Phytoactinopolyspora halotolerans]NEE02317.1 glycosyltransferase family 1 protein [Phytoactinopolyspora halotolerans]